ncbi:hypothetical protein MNEG_2550 [Monoraphidium neglectum]|uniref:Uncharacterized protein n=1 Tax=Monoraphidium neglectum TaxID=145388 RepID=A0A0D2MS77_9CHLO|nr:hypothetical protein MNEG_2550 [Monoraphidium neglectum]KIZ05415.1 hypothetical protein MNEG_2550 [Monoraphidium neglectum]|eukprot:XP_013904434.1 hypothetical protein MNEG_2550 [Monoraphidium neglectum]
MLALTPPPLPGPLGTLPRCLQRLAEGAKQIADYGNAFQQDFTTLVHVVNNSKRAATTDDGSGAIVNVCKTFDNYKKNPTVYADPTSDASINALLASVCATLNKNGPQAAAALAKASLKDVVNEAVAKNKAKNTQSHTTLPTSTGATAASAGAAATPAVKAASGAANGLSALSGLGSGLSGLNIGNGQIANQIATAAVTQLLPQLLASVDQQALQEANTPVAAADDQTASTQAADQTTVPRR